MPMKKIPTITQQEHRIGIAKNNKPYIYEQQELKNARALLRDSLAKNVPDVEYTSPVRLIVKWCYPITGKHFNGEYKATKPDTDNIIKMLKDEMTKLHFWKDDALVASEINEKFYSAVVGIFVSIEELSQDIPWN